MTTNWTALAQWPDLGELRTAVLLKLQGSDSAELALSDGQLVTLKGGAARPLAKLQRGAWCACCRARLGARAGAGGRRRRRHARPLWRPDPALVGGLDFTRNQYNHARRPTAKPGWPQALGLLGLDRAGRLGRHAGQRPAHRDRRLGAAHHVTAGTKRACRCARALARLQEHGDHPAGAGSGRSGRGPGLRFGLEEERQPLNLTLALGTGAATPLQMARAHGALPTAYASPPRG